jgi:hypothetical protein
MYVAFFDEPNYQINGLKFFFHEDVLKDAIVRDHGMFLFVTLRLLYVTYVAVFYTKN